MKKPDFHLSLLTFGVCDPTLTALASADVPKNLTRNHEPMLSAIDALIDTRDDRLAAIDDLSGEALLGFLWSPTPEIDEFENVCAELQAVAEANGVTVHVCPN
jgi:hypothetical protein